MSVKVSVVVPVYNPGEHIDPLIRSLQGQTMPQSDFEAIFVDDGSTDETPEKLDRLADAHTNVTVIHIPNSGWPGKPRNIGIETAVGEYVQFVDHDDELGVEALERMYAYATENGSDVVVGKEVRRTGKWTIGPIFDRNRPYATLENDPILGILTPHKMFRRDFLNKHHIRFFEGPRRMEDHPFVVEAFFKADVISVLSDYPVYYWNRRPDRGNAGARPFDWAEYYVYMRDVLDVVERHTDPGDFRNRLLSFWYDSKGLGIVTRSVGRRPREAVRSHFEALRALAEERFPPPVDKHLVGVMRVRSELLRADDFEAMEALGRLEHGIHLEHELTELRATAGRLRFRARVALCYADGTPLTFEVVDGRYLWRPPVDLGPAVSTEALDFTTPYLAKRVQLILRNRRTGEAHLVAGKMDTEEIENGSKPYSFEADFEVDPRSVGTGVAMGPAVYDVFVRASCNPWRPHAHLRSPSDASVGKPLTAVLSTGLTVRPYTTSRGTVALDVGQQKSSLLRSASLSPASARILERESEALLTVPLDGLALSGKPPSGRIRFVPEAGGKPVVAPFRISGGREGRPAILRARFRTNRHDPANGVGQGRWRVVAVLEKRRTDLGLRLEVDGSGAAALTDDHGGVLGRIPEARGLVSRMRRFPLR